MFEYLAQLIFHNLPVNSMTRLIQIVFYAKNGLVRNYVIEVSISGLLLFYKSLVKKLCHY